MKRLALPVPGLTILGVLSMILATAGAADDRQTPTPAPGKLVVHEWGTFTGFAGSDGVHLPFASGIGSDLPQFVFTRAEQSDRLNPNLNAATIELLTGGKEAILAMQRMETPVVYFYTDAPREVEARVQFPQGLLTEFYPPVRSMTPAYDPKRGETRNAASIQNSSLDWGKLRIDPDAGGARFPKADPASPQEVKNHYFHARATDAATVQFSDRPNEVHEENFLFYRGLGNFTLPVTLTASGDEKFVLYNNSEAPIAAAFLIRIKDGKARFSAYRSVGRQQEMTLPPEECTAKDLAGAVVKALVAEGLYEKEARAMVKTWESTWFGNEGTGTRLLYTLPRRVTDTLLPLRINPTPDETVRVMVGRIDILTPEQETRLAALFAKAEKKGAITPEEAREGQSLGRFLQPALERAAKARLLKLIRAIHEADPC